MNGPVGTGNWLVMDNFRLQLMNCVRSSRFEPGGVHISEKQFLARQAKTLVLFCAARRSLWIARARQVEGAENASKACGALGACSDSFLFVPQSQH